MGKNAQFMRIIINLRAAWCLNKHCTSKYQSIYLNITNLFYRDLLKHVSPDALLLSKLIDFWFLKISTVSRASFVTKIRALHITYIKIKYSAPETVQHCTFLVIKCLLQ